MPWSRTCRSRRRARSGSMRRKRMAHKPVRPCQRTLQPIVRPEDDGPEGSKAGLVEWLVDVIIRHHYALVAEADGHGFRPAIIMPEGVRSWLT